MYVHPHPPLSQSGGSELLCTEPATVCSEAADLRKHLLRPARPKDLRPYRRRGERNSFEVEVVKGRLRRLRSIHFGWEQTDRGKALQMKKSLEFRCMGREI